MFHRHTWRKIFQREDETSTKAEASFSLQRIPGTVKVWAVLGAEVAKECGSEKKREEKASG